MAKKPSIVQELAQEHKEKVEQETSTMLRNTPAFTLSKIGGEWTVTKHMVAPEEGEKLRSSSMKSDAIELFKIAVGESELFN